MYELCGLNYSDCVDCTKDIVYPTTQDVATKSVYMIVGLLANKDSTLRTFFFILIIEPVTYIM